MMRPLPAILTICAAMFVLPVCAAPDAAKPASGGMPGSDTSLSGKWTGLLSRSSDTDVKEVAVRLTLDDAKAKVEYQKKNGVWKEVMPGLFHISIQGSNAVIQGTNTGKIEDTTWVETWIFGATRQSDSALRVGYIRVVNNVTSPSSDEGKAFAYGLSGTLERVTPAALAAEENSPIVQITAEESGRFQWRGKSMSAAELKAALLAEKKLRSITEVRLLEGEAYPDMKQLMGFADAVQALGLKKAFFEREGEFKTIDWPDGD